MQRQQVADLDLTGPAGLTLISGDALSMSSVQTWRENLFSTRVARFENGQSDEHVAGPSSQPQIIQRYPLDGEADVKPGLAGGAEEKPMRLRGGGVRTLSGS